MPRHSNILRTSGNSAFTSQNKQPPVPHGCEFCHGSIRELFFSGAFWYVSGPLDFSTWQANGARPEKFPPRSDPSSPVRILGVVICVVTRFCLSRSGVVHTSRRPTTSISNSNIDSPRFTFPEGAHQDSCLCGVVSPSGTYLRVEQ